MEGKLAAIRGEPRERPDNRQKVPGFITGALNPNPIIGIGINEYVEEEG